MANNDDRIESLKGTWNYIDGENFDGLLKEMELNEALLILAKNLKLRLTIGESNGQWLFESDAVFKKTAYEFFPNVEFEGEGYGGGTYRMIVKFKDGKWIQTAHSKNGKELLIERWVNEKGQLQTIMRCGNIAATLVFQRCQ